MKSKSYHSSNNKVKYFCKNIVVVVVFVGKTPVCEEWPNYEVVEFQPWSGTSPDLGSVAIVRY